jgi:hypothetical protein
MRGKRGELDGVFVALKICQLLQLYFSLARRAI